MNSKYLTKLWLEDVDGNIFIVCAHFGYYSELLKGEVWVPIRTETDLASIPNLVRGIFPKSGLYNPASVLHDAGYNNCLVTNSGIRIYLTKHLCDSLFYEAMGVSGVGNFKRMLFFKLVSAFGVKSK